MFIILYSDSFFNYAVSRCIIQDGRPLKLHLRKLGHLDLCEQYVETVDHTRDVSGSEANIDYFGLL